MLLYFVCSTGQWFTCSLLPKVDTKLGVLPSWSYSDWEILNQHCVFNRNAGRSVYIHLQNHSLGAQSCFHPTRFLWKLFCSKKRSWIGTFVFVFFNPVERTYYFGFRPGLTGQVFSLTRKHSVLQKSKLSGSKLSGDSQVFMCSCSLQVLCRCFPLRFNDLSRRGTCGGGTKRTHCRYDYSRVGNVWKSLRNSHNRESYHSALEFSNLIDQNMMFTSGCKGDTLLSNKGWNYWLWRRHIRPVFSALTLTLCWDSIY